MDRLNKKEEKKSTEELEEFQRELHQLQSRVKFHRCGNLCKVVQCCRRSAKAKQERKVEKTFYYIIDFNGKIESTLKKNGPLPNTYPMVKEILIKSRDV